MSSRTRLYLDILMLIAFIAAYRPFTTGLAFHEWLSLLLVVPTLAHMVINWDWAARVARSFGRRLRATTRLNLVVDAALFVSAVAVMMSGFLVSTTLAHAVGLSLSPEALWHSVHAVSADASIALLLVHTGLHWRWFARNLGFAVPRYTRRPQLAPVPVRRPRETR